MTCPQSRGRQNKANTSLLPYFIPHSSTHLYRKNLAKILPSFCSHQTPLLTDTTTSATHPPTNTEYNPIYHQVIIIRTLFCLTQYPLLLLRTLSLFSAKSLLFLTEFKHSMSPSLYQLLSFFLLSLSPLHKLSNRKSELTISYYSKFDVIAKLKYSTRHVQYFLERGLSSTSLTKTI